MKNEITKTNAVEMSFTHVAGRIKTALIMAMPVSAFFFWAFAVPSLVFFLEWHAQVRTRWIMVVMEVGIAVLAGAAMFGVIELFLVYDAASTMLGILQSLNAGDRLIQADEHLDKLRLKFSSPRVVLFVALYVAMVLLFSVFLFLILPNVCPFCEKLYFPLRFMHFQELDMTHLALYNGSLSLFGIFYSQQQVLLAFANILKTKASLQMNGVLADPTPQAPDVATVLTGEHVSAITSVTQRSSDHQDTD